MCSETDAGAGGAGAETTRRLVEAELRLVLYSAEAAETAQPLYFTRYIQSCIQIIQIHPEVHSEVHSECILRWLTSTDGHSVEGEPNQHLIASQAARRERPDADALHQGRPRLGERLRRAQVM